MASMCIPWEVEAHISRNVHLIRGTLEIGIGIHGKLEGEMVQLATDILHILVRQRRMRDFHRLG